MLVLMLLTLATLFIDDNPQVPEPVPPVSPVHEGLPADRHLVHCPDEKSHQEEGFSRAQAPNRASQHLSSHQHRHGEAQSTSQHQEGCPLQQTGRSQQPNQHHPQKDPGRHQGVLKYLAHGLHEVFDEGETGAGAAGGVGC